MTSSQAQHEQNKMNQFGGNIFRNMEPSFWSPVMIVVLVSKISKIQRKNWSCESNIGGGSGGNGWWWCRVRCVRKKWEFSGVLSRFCGNFPRRINRANLIINPWRRWLFCPHSRFEPCSPFCFCHVACNIVLYWVALCWTSIGLPHHDVIKWEHVPRYWQFLRGIHRSPVNSPHKGQWRGALMFSLICAWINGWLNNSEAGDFRRHRPHYDVIIMSLVVRRSFSYCHLFEFRVPNICL